MAPHLPRLVCGCRRCSARRHAMLDAIRMALVATSVGHLAARGVEELQINAAILDELTERATSDGVSEGEEV